MDSRLKGKLKRLLIGHEDDRKRAYLDLYGNITAGIGHNLSARDIADDIRERWVNEDMEEFFSGLSDSFPWFKELDENRQIALIDMTFTLGMNGIKEFKNMLAALERKDYAVAALCIMQSKWAHQVGQRAVDVSSIVRTGIISD